MSFNSGLHNFISSNPTQKRKIQHEQDHTINVDTSRPSAVFKPKKRRQHTISIALPGSIIAKYVWYLQQMMIHIAKPVSALTHEQKTALAGQIARACAVFCIDEIVVFDDGQAEIRDPEHGGYTAFADPNYFLYHVLSYLETPPHLRRALFPMHPDLRTAGALPSLDMPHHLRSEEWCPYREGVALRQSKQAGGITHTAVDCGLPQQVHVAVALEEKTRLTIRLPESPPGDRSALEGEPVAPDAPRQEAGYYWGYAVRQASSLSAVFTECPHDGGYDISIGTSERGAPLNSVLDVTSTTHVPATWSHLLIVFGGVAGLEAALSVDVELKAAGVGRAEEIFDRWVNAVPGQGSRTIRTEEALWVALTGLRPLVDARADI